MENELNFKQEGDTNNSDELWDETQSIIKKVLDDIFFVQQRVWKSWDVFNVFKIRTMQKDADNNIPDSCFIWNKTFSDERIIKSRNWMRKTWFDELPQIINILKWEMAFFWNRPISVNVFDSLTEEQQKRRSKYKPGIFWWYAFYNKWKRYKSRTIRQNQDVYLKIRNLKEKKWKIEMIKYNFYIFIENIKAILNWVNR
jgi:lipopolysaccharide/colanic/teichoic acid biosynthesis glycosyltransferase